MQKCDILKKKQSKAQWRQTRDYFTQSTVDCGPWTVDFFNVYSLRDRMIKDVD